MPPENLPKQGADHRYATIMFPARSSGKPRAFSVTGWGLVSGIASFILVVVVLTVAAIVYTPVLNRFPIADREVEKRYGSQIAGIQKQLQGLAQELNTLTGYNLRLRRAMGEKISGNDSMAASDSSRSLFDSRESGEGRSAVADQGNVEEPGEQPRLTYSPATNGERAELPAQMPLSMPAEGYLSRGYDSLGDHYGIDIAGKEGSGILAAADGHIVFSGWTFDDGFTLMIAHADGFVTVYKHNQSLLKNTGAAVKRGDVVALMGNTGRASSGSHLHFEVWKNGIADNPQRYLLTTP